MVRIVLMQGVKVLDNSKGVRIKASELFVECLEREGVSLIFGVPGEENADLMMALSQVVLIGQTI